MAISVLVKDLNLEDIIKCIREFVQDLAPVHSFSVTTKNYDFSKAANYINYNSVLDDVSSQESKVYKVLNTLNATNNGTTEITTSIALDYVATEVSSLLVDFQNEDEKELKVYSQNYFSEYTIQKHIIEFFNYYLCVDYVPKTVEEIINRMDYTMKRKVCLWVAFYLIDEKRKNYASVKYSKSQDGTDDDCTSSDMVNKTQNITTSVGDVFSVTESFDESGKGFENFTALWGDKYEYLTKCQLWIRDRFEKVFKDGSLRDGHLFSTSISNNKHWTPYAYGDTKNLSENFGDIFLPNYEVLQ